MLNLSHLSNSIDVSIISNLNYRNSSQQQAFTFTAVRLMFFKWKFNHVTPLLKTFPQLPNTLYDKCQNPEQDHIISFLRSSPPLFLFLNAQPHWNPFSSSFCFYRCYFCHLQCSLTNADSFYLSLKVSSLVLPWFDHQHCPTIPGQVRFACNILSYHLITSTLTFILVVIIFFSFSLFQNWWFHEDIELICLVYCFIISFNIMPGIQLIAFNKYMLNNWTSLNWS